MGSNFSSDTSENARNGQKVGIGLGHIPESCVALVLMNLDPPEICKLARLNRAFRSASSADFIWESKLPSNYAVLMEKVLDMEEKIVLRMQKRDIYAFLSSPNPFDGGQKVMWLDKNLGGICLSISWRAMKITGIGDRRYWNHISSEESRFQTIAYLRQTWWFEVSGELEFEFPPGLYSMFFRLHLGKSLKRRGRRICDPKHIHGWDLKPVRFHLTTSDSQPSSSQYYLNNPGSWVLYHVGDFKIHKSNSKTKIRFSLTQIDCTHTKGGVCVDSVLVRPGWFREDDNTLCH